VDDKVSAVFTTDQQTDIRERALEFAEVGTFRYRMDGTIVQLDKGALKILDIGHLYAEPAQVIGKKLEDLFIYLNPRGTVREMVLKNREVRNYEFPFKTLKGESRWSLHDSFLVNDPLTGEVFVQVTARNITVLKERELQLAEANHKLEEQKQRQIALEQTANAAWQGQVAALNLMEDADEARSELEARNRRLQREIAERTPAD